MSEYGTRTKRAGPILWAMENETAPPEAVIVGYRECARCKESLRILQVTDERQVAIDRKSGERHVCWNLPEDANLVVLDD